MTSEFEGLKTMCSYRWWRQSLDVCCHAKIRCILKLDLVVSLLLLKHNDLIYSNRRKSETVSVCRRAVSLFKHCKCQITFFKSIMMQDKTLKGIVQHLGEAWSMPLWCLDARNRAKASSQLTVPPINDVWCTALPGWFHCWEKDQGGRESAGDQWTSSDPDSSHW